MPPVGSASASALATVGLEHYHSFLTAMNNQPVTVQTIAEWIDGAIDGDAEVMVSGIESLAAATGDELSFADGTHLAKLAETQAGAVIVPVGAQIENASLTLIRVESVDKAVAALLARWAPPEQHPPVGIAASAVIDPSAKLGEDVAVGPNVIIGPGAVVGDRVVLCGNVSIGQDVTLGEATVILEGAVVMARCRIGQRVRIGPNSAVGGEGFGYYFAKDEGVHHRLVHMGDVVIEDDVHLGSCVCVDRGKFGSTRIGRGTKVDNFVQIAHSVKIGEHCLVTAQCGIAGSTTLGNYVVLGGATGVRDNIHIGDGVQVTAYSAIAADIPAGEVYGGIPARPLSIMRRFWLAQPKVPELLKRVKKLESALKKLDGSSEDN